MNPPYEGRVEQGAQGEMATVTYKNQPGIAATDGHSTHKAWDTHVYKVHKKLWPEAVEDFIETLLIPKSLHVCCGVSKLGDVRLDIDPVHQPDVVADAAHLPFADESFASVLCDPPYSCRRQGFWCRWCSTANEYGAPRVRDRPPAC